MARRPGNMVKEYVEKFLNTDYQTDTGVMGKSYSIVLPHCKVFMKYADRQTYPEIEMIKFQDLLLVKDPEIWKLPAGHAFANLNKYLYTPNNIQNSKQIDYNTYNGSGSLVQLGNDLFYLFQMDTKVSQAGRKITDFSSRLGYGKSHAFPVKDKEIKTIKEVQEKYFQGEIFAIRNLLMTPAIEDEVPVLSDYFTKSELELMDRTIEEKESLVHIRSHWDRFAYDTTPAHNEWRNLKDKQIALIEKLKRRRVPDNLKYDLGFLKWQPGCEAISDGEDYIYLKGPWELRNEVNKDFTEALSKKWHTMYKI